MIYLFIFFSFFEIYFDINSFKNIENYKSNGFTEQKQFPFFKNNVKTGSAPKSCIFSNDSKYIYVSLLHDKDVGVQVFDLKLNKIKTLQPFCKDKTKNIGYPESDFGNDDKFYFTRMTTGEFFIYDNESGLIESFKTKGIWSKIIKVSEDNKYALISNWLSDTVSVFDINKKKVIKLIKTKKIPRGIAFIDEKTIAIAIYQDGVVQVFDIEKNKLLKEIKVFNKANIRDIEYDKDKKLLYFSDMYNGYVFKYDYNKQKLLSKVKVFQNTNSIRLTQDGKYIFVSSRGPNNKKNYTFKSPENGILFLIDTEKFEIIKKWEGGNQPTGVGLSKDGKYLCTTDFLDNNLNLYVIGE